MDLIELQQLLESLDRAASTDQIVASDGDGTMWRGDISDALFLEFVQSNSVRPITTEALVNEAVAHDIDVAKLNPSQTARALFEAYQDGRYPEERALRMMAWVYAGYRPAELDPLIDDVFQKIDFGNAIRAELREVFHWAEQRSLAAWLVSASPEFLVLRAADVIGIPRERTLGMTSALDNGVLQPRLSGTVTYADGKLARLSEETTAPLLAAFGDSNYDGALLRAAAIPIAVAPTQALRDEAETIPNLCELRLAHD